MNRFKRGLAILLSTCMIGGMIPLPASAEETVSENIVQTECIEKTENLENAPSEDEKSSETVHETGSETESETVTDAETEGTAISAIQALIDALPDADSITEDNVENVTSQLDTIDEAKAELSDADMLQLDLTRYDAAINKVMVLMGMNMLEIFPRRLKLYLRLPAFIRRKTGKSKTPFLVGLCNGLMPCGPLQSMQIVALASGNAFVGALSMLCFSLGTVPLMLGFGFIFSSLGKRFTKQVLKFGAVLVVVLGLSMISQGSALSGIDSKVFSAFSKPEENQEVQAKLNETIEKDGVQYVSSVLESGKYPDITIKAGEPVVWEIEADKGSINGCNYKILLQDFDMEYTFSEGENVIEFTPEKEGVYTYSCWMGMITGKIYVEK